MMPLKPSQRENLINAALLAFSGDHGVLVHGFRISNLKGQAAAVYWSALAPNNELEIALAPARMADKYSLTFVQAWMRQVRFEHPAECEVHQHGSDWPIVGGSYSFAIEFLSECRDVRRGFVNAKRQRQIEALLKDRSPQDVLTAQLEAQREALRPTKQYAVIDLVRRAGISVDAWYIRADGTAARAPRSNPSHCYNWSFGGGTGPALACLWHQSLRIVGDAIECHGNLREDAMALEKIALDRQRPDDHRERARTQAVRARRLDELIAEGFTFQREMRVIVNEGYMRPDTEVGAERSVVRVRQLDPCAWDVVHYNGTGAFVMRRKSAADGRSPSMVEKPFETTFADQYDLPGSDSPETVATSGFVKRRDRKVRIAALERAQGHCELCDAPGFAMSDGRLYLETHHVVSLAKGGPDRLTNVIALCPSHHREAHHGARSEKMRNELLELLQTYNGENEPVLLKTL